MTRLKFLMLVLISSAFLFFRCSNCDLSCSRGALIPGHFSSCLLLSPAGRTPPFPFHSGNMSGSPPLPGTIFSLFFLTTFHLLIHWSGSYWRNFWETSSETGEILGGKATRGWYQTWCQGRFMVGKVTSVSGAATLTFASGRWRGNRWTSLSLMNPG